MLSEIEEEAKGKAARATPSKVEFLEEAKKRFPWVTWEEGLPQGTDKYGNKYITLVVGGIKDEGAYYPCFFTSPDHKLWLSWWEVLARFIDTSITEVQIRKFPEVSHEVEYVLDTFSSYMPKLVPREKYQIFSRFSFIKNIGENSNG